MISAQTERFPGGGDFMGKVIQLKPEDRLSGVEALKLMRAWMKENSKCVKFTNHGTKRRNGRRITQPQVLTCLQKGIVTEPPHINAGILILIDAEFSR
jgi:hypothetical protein